MSDTFRSLSFGAGIGSTALAIATIEGLKVNGFDFGLHRPNVIAFADTGGELQATYRHVEEFGEWVRSKGVEFVVLRRKGPDLRTRVLDRIAGKTRSGAPCLPFHLEPDGKAMQQCTYDYKGTVLDKYLLRTTKAMKWSGPVRVMQGLTFDEFHRMRTARDYWPKTWAFSYPMIDAKCGRGWAVDVCRAHLGRVPQSSACFFCPHRADVGPGSRAWIRENEPETWARLVEFDAAIRNGYAGLRQKAFLSGLRLPVTEAVDVASKQGHLFGATFCGDGGSCGT